MAQETILAIREAEQQAAQAEAEAVRTAKQIVEEAKQKAAQEKSQRIQNARQAADQALEEAQEQCRVMMAEAEALEREEAVRLEKEVSGKRVRAVQAVLDHLL